MDFPMKNGGYFHSFLYVLPEGNRQIKASHGTEGTRGKARNLIAFRITVI